MISFQKLRRFSWTALAIVIATAASGCKQVSTWGNMSPRASTPSADPFEFPTTSETYFHRPQSAPELAPVPELPSPGHSSPMDPPPPAPSPLPPGEGATLPTPKGDAVTARPNSKWNLRPMGFLNRKPAQSTGVQSADANEQHSNGLGLRPSKSASSPSLGASAPFNDTPSFGTRPSSAPNNPTAASKTLLPPALNPSPQTPENSLDANYSGPVITPGAQYTIGKNVPIETWPYAMRANDGATVPLRKQLPQFNADDFAPQSANIDAGLLPPPASPASVPLMLPPGP